MLFHRLTALVLLRSYCANWGGIFLTDLHVILRNLGTASATLDLTSQPPFRGGSSVIDTRQKGGFPHGTPPTSPHMTNMGYCGVIMGQKGGYYPIFRGYTPPLGGYEGVIEGYPPKGVPSGPKKGQKPPFFVPTKGVPLVGTFYVRVSVRKMPFSTLKFPSASRKGG